MIDASVIPASTMAVVPLLITTRTSAIVAAVLISGRLARDVCV